MKLFSKIPQLEKEDYYYSTEGYIIFTEKYHLKRGACCNNNCKHCPYKKEGEKKEYERY
jgi:2-iminoacetate synthase ThiH